MRRCSRRSRVAPGSSGVAPLATRQEMVRIADALQRCQRGFRSPPVRCRSCARQHRVDRGRHELDVTELLGRDVGHEIVERPCSLAIAEVEGLERVVRERGHLPEAATHELLNRRRSRGIGLGGRRQLGGDAVDAADHLGLQGRGRLRIPGADSAKHLPRMRCRDVHIPPDVRDGTKVGYRHVDETSRARAESPPPLQRVVALGPGGSTCGPSGPSASRRSVELGACRSSRGGAARALS